MKSKKIYIYTGPGAGEESIRQTDYCFRQILQDVKIEFVNDKNILDLTWEKDAWAFVMPGGADVPYTRKLNGDPNAKIKTYVENGGTYIGICAGGYYGSAFVDFDRGGRLEVLGDRELQFFRGTAIGPIVAPYDYHSHSGVRAVTVKNEITSELFQVYFSGGCYFENAMDDDETKILARYVTEKENALPAVICIKQKSGRVILSGVHFEFSYEFLNETDPHLIAVIPKLRETDSLRMAFVKNIFREI